MAVLTHAIVVLHPYFKLWYIEEKWGGENDYQAALANGDPNPRNWQQYARDVVEKAIRNVVHTC